MNSQTCCGCMSIKTGVITLGVISLLGGIGDIIFGSIIIGSYNNCYGNYNSNCYYEDIHVVQNRTDPSEGVRDGSWYGTTSVIQGSIGVLVSILMLVGVSKKKPNLLIPYVTIMIINVVAYICVGIVLLSNTSYYGAYYGIWYLCWSCVVCYFVSVVRLYRLLMIQQIMAANGLITTYPSGAILTPGVMINPYPSVATVYTTQPGYTTQTTYSTQQAYPAPGSYPQPGYAQPGYPQSGYPQPGYPQPGYPNQGYGPQQGIYPPQNSYPPPYPGNQPGKI